MLYKITDTHNIISTKGALIAAPRGYWTMIAGGACAGETWRERGVLYLEYTGVHSNKKIRDKSFQVQLITDQRWLPHHLKRSVDLFHTLHSWGCLRYRIRCLKYMNLARHTIAAKVQRESGLWILHSKWSTVIRIQLGVYRAASSQKLFWTLGYESQHEVHRYGD